MAKMKSNSGLKSPFLRRLAIDVEKLGEGWPFEMPLLQDGGLVLDFTTPVTVLVGENGAGKSTLLEGLAAAAGFPEDGGGAEHGTGRPADWAPLARSLRLSWQPKVNSGFFMRAESFFNFARYIDHAGNPERWGGTPLHGQSHGESFLALYLNRLDEPGLYLLDEPEAALSPNRELSFLCILREMEKSGRAQVIMATHSPILMAYPGARVLALSEDGAEEVDYRDTDHFRLYERFLRAPDTYLKYLFEEDGG